MTVSNKLVSDPYGHERSSYENLRRYCEFLGEQHTKVQHDAECMYVAMRRIAAMAVRMGESAEARCRQIQYLANQAADEYIAGIKRRIAENKAKENKEVTK